MITYKALTLTSCLVSVISSTHCPAPENPGMVSRSPGGVTINIPFNSQWNALTLVLFHLDGA